MYADRSPWLLREGAARMAAGCGVDSTVQRPHPVGAASRANQATAPPQSCPTTMRLADSGRVQQADHVVGERSRSGVRRRPRGRAPGE